MNEDIKQALANFENMKKADLLLEIQKLGKTVNPGKKREELFEILKDLVMKNAQQLPEAPSEVTKKNEKDITAEEPLTDTEKILNAIGGVVKSVEAIDKRLKKVETGDANAFKDSAKPEDVESAASMNANVDKRIVSIVEKTLGIDFGVEMEGYDDKPGILLTILVPQRLSPIPTSFRPIKDEKTGEYKIDAKGRQEEEEYWPGDRRSVAMGANDSFDVVQKHANRVRSFIMATYQKQNKPQPDFRVKE